MYGAFKWIRIYWTPPSLSKRDTIDDVQIDSELLELASGYGHPMVEFIGLFNSLENHIHFNSFFTNKKIWLWMQMLVPKPSG